MSTASKAIRAEEVPSGSGDLPATQEISTEAKLLRGAFRMAGFAVGSVVRTGQWAAETSLEVGRQLAQVAANSESAGDLVEFAGERLRSIARETLGVDEQPVREVVSYVPVHTPPGIDGMRPRSSASAAELRRRGDELYNLSSDLDFTDEVHPAYSRILDELAPDEARILCFLALNGEQPIVDVRTNRPFGIGSELVAADLSSVPLQAAVSYMDRAGAYLVNLKRLGLVVVQDDPVLLSRYMVLEVQPDVDEAMRKAGRAPKIVRKTLALTDFGADFCRTCFTLTHKR